MKIINNTSKLFSIVELEVIHGEMAFREIDMVWVFKSPNDGHSNTLLDFCNEDGDYLFSIDTDADGACIAVQF